MDKQTTYLIDDIIRYSLDREIPLDKAGRQLTELAKQRLPEYQLELEQRSGEFAILTQIRQSDTRSIVMRVPIRSWIHEVHWSYYPEFHVISSPFEYYAFPVHANIDGWPAISDPKTAYLDDIFFDKDDGYFWQPEPYLTGLTVSARAYKHITSDKLEKLRGTPYLKVSPEIIAEFLQTRSGLPNYTIKPSDSDLGWRQRPQGSKGWKDRMAGVTRYWSRRRKTNWKFK